MTRPYFWKFLLLSVISFSLCHSQETDQETPIIMRLANGDTAFVHALDSADVLYLSLNDFLKSQQYPGIVNDTTRKIECLIASQLVRFTDQNPFVVITERLSNTATVYQMPARVIYRHKNFFVPVFTFVTLFERVADKPLVFDEYQRKLEISPSTSPFDITGIEIEKKLNGSLITILANKKLGDFETWLKPDGWLFVTITGVTADTTVLNNTKPSEAIKKVLTFQSPASVQLTFRVTPDVVQAEAANDRASNNLLISLRVRSESERKEIERKKQETVKLSHQKRRDRWKLDVIVIDAGHGGRDPGTVGVVGTYEKNITLSVALKLGQLIEKNLKDVQVVYTRTQDRFVELYRRTQIANEASGKLFVSLHCNALPHKPSKMNGFEIYLLRPNRSEEAVAIASRENGVIELEEGYQQRYQKLTEEEFIIVTMAQSSYMKYSEQFAECTIGSMVRNLRIKNSGVKQAGFYVLVGASMPNVLVELGYLSNRKEEQFLRSQDGQRNIADALFKGIKNYKMKYEQALQEGEETEVQ
jgi:N-acetylmuramoyl-L-alanine amidase